MGKEIKKHNETWKKFYPLISLLVKALALIPMIFMVLTPFAGGARSRERALIAPRAGTLINVAIKHCHINKIFYSRFARPLRGNRKTWQLLLRQVHVFQIGKEIFTCRSNNTS